MSKWSNKFHLWFDWYVLRPQRREALWQWLAWHLPRKLVMWAAVRLIAHATQGPYSNQIVPDLRAMDALHRWNTP